MTNSHYDHLTDASPVQILCLSILAFVLIAVGLAPGWLVGLINAGVQPVLAKVAATAGAVAHGTLPVVLGNGA
jgi:NADH-quinone oxidoreductase subunit M